MGNPGGVLGGVDAIPLMFQKEHPGSRVKDDFQEGETGLGGYRNVLWTCPRGKYLGFLHPR